ncbi:DUF2213 domain-containing protein, partial [Turicimonas muris]|uniref:DUF2213 domain-containing protein n=1 Tax=Turicimonas muris TaxID=1796652 RepID=UPI0025B0CB27
MSLSPLALVLPIPLSHNRSIAFDSVSVRSIDKNGFLHVAKSPLTKVQVAPYLGKEISNYEALNLEPGKIYYAYRPADELKSQETIESVNGIPIHLQHHDDYGEPESKLTRIGTTGTDGNFDYPYLFNSLHIHDKDAIKRIEDESMKELSLAYSYVADFTPGVTEAGEKYDYVQRQIRANHLALVETGRAGPEVKVRDSKQELLKMDEETKNDATEKAEVTLAQAIIDLHKTTPDGEVTDVQDEDKNAKIEKIIESLKAKGLSDDEAEQLKTTLTDLAYPKATGDSDEKVKDEAQPANDEEKEVNMDEEVKDDDKELDEKMKDPAFKAGFEAGTRYGEKVEKEDPKGIDADHEREGMEDKLTQDALKACGLDEAPEEVQNAFKAGLNYGDKEQAEDSEEELEAKDEEEEKKEVTASDSMKVLKKAMYAEMKAIDDVKPVLGNIRLGAYDSAGAVYVAALNKLGVKGVSSRDARSAYFAYMKGRNAGSSKFSFAKDSAPTKPSALG